MAENRTDIAIATAEAIGELLVREVDTTIKADDPLLPGLARAQSVVGTFLAVARKLQSPRVGRPRKPKAEA